MKTAVRRFNDSWTFALNNGKHKSIEDGYKAYNNRRTRRQYDDGVTDTFVPLSFSTVETTVAALGANNFRLDYEPADPTIGYSKEEILAVLQGQSIARKTPIDTKGLNALIDDYWYKDQWGIKFTDGSREMSKTGDAAFYVSWEGDRPVLTHFPYKDAIVDPTVTSQAELQKRGYAGRRYLTTRDALAEEMVVDPKTGKMIQRYKNLEQVPKESSYSGVELTDKDWKEMFDGASNNDRDDLVEVIEIWDQKKKITIANRFVVLEDIENPFVTRTKRLFAAGKTRVEKPKAPIPFFFFRNYTDVSKFHSKSDIDPILPHQELLNDATNMEWDAIIKQLRPQRELDPMYDKYRELINDDPGTVYPFKPGSLGFVQVNSLPANSFNGRQSLKQEMREATALDQVARGAGAQDQTTATEINAQMNQSSQRIELKAEMLELDGFFWFGVILFQYIQLYVDEPMFVNITSGSSDTQLGAYNPADFMDEWIPRIQLESRAKSQQNHTQSKALQDYQVLIADPTNNIAEVKKRMFPKMFPDLSQEDIEAIITPAQPAMDPMADPMAGAMDPTAGAPAAPAAPAMTRGMNG